MCYLNTDMCAFRYTWLDEALSYRSCRWVSFASLMCSKWYLFFFSDDEKYVGYRSCEAVGLEVILIACVLL